MSRRGVFEVTVRLLEALEEGPCNKANLANKASLDAGSRRHIDLLLGLDLMSESDSNYFIITGKGRAFLEGYKKLNAQQ